MFVLTWHHVQFLSLQGMASKMLELGLDSRGFPSEEVAVGARSPPRFHADGGNGFVVTLIGSGYAVLRHLVMYDQTFLGRTLLVS